MANPFRAAVRIQDAQRAQKRSAAFSGATSSRLTADWVLASIQSADQEIRGDLRTLRARSRELVRNNDTAARYLDLVEDNVVGHEGIRLQAQNRRREDDALWHEVNDRIEEAWSRWSEKENASVDGRLDRADIEHLSVRTVPQDGETLVRMVGGFRGNDFGFALHVLDPDQLDHEFNRPEGTGPRGERRNEIRMGVEIDRWGRPVAYWLWDHHPTEHFARERKHVRVPADQIIHLYRLKRANQTRGVPWFAPSLFKLKMLGGYEEAELVASRVAAAKGGWFERDAEALTLDPDSEAADERLVYEAEPGVFDALPPGWKFKAWDPTHPTNAFNDFHKAMLRGIANGLGVSYTNLANNLEDVNFSSIRAGLLNERDAWRKTQRWFIRHFHRRVFREWLKWSLTTGALRLPSRRTSDWTHARWQPRGWPWVDPEKDLRAAAMAIRLGLDSRTRLAAEQGRDFQEILRDLRAEEELAEELGVELSTDLSKSGGSRDDEAAAADGRISEEHRRTLAAAFSPNGRNHADEG